MARGINKVILIGNLGNDPDIRHTTNGNTVANISLATTDIWKDKQSGEAQERTEWHRVVFFTRLAEIVAQYLHKGSKIYIEGSLRTRKWQDQNGVERYTTEIIADEMQMLDSKGASGAQDKHELNMQPSGQPAAIKVQPSRNVKPLVGTTPEDTMQAVDDDIPF